MTKIAERESLGPPRKRFGQHFLADPAVVERIVAAICPAPDDLLVEIGPGTGVLTQALLRHQAHLHAVEIDRDLVRALRARFDVDRLTLHCADALRFDFGALGSRLRLVGNLPYNISTPLLFHIVEHMTHVRDCHFMLQKEVVDRMAAAPDSSDYGRLSVMVQYRFRVEPLFEVAPQAFRPPPKVESAVVRLTPWDTPPVSVRHVALFEEVVRVAFTQRRKMVRNALGAYVAPDAWSHLGLAPNLRPENLSVADFARVANHAAENAS